MISSRRQGREAALQALYLFDICGIPVGELPCSAWSDVALDEKTQEFAQHLAQGTTNRLETIDPIISKYAQNWEIKRMASIDRCILRLATFELLNDVETPVNVVINEAVDIAKKYSTAESGKFVNGILDKVKSERPSNLTR